MKLIIISGRSGSGKSSALHTLEDEGFYCVDNLPASMLSQLPDTLKGHHSKPPRMAVSIDVRNLPGALNNFPDLLASLRQKGIDCQVLYLDTDSEKLVSRYSATRRKHPLSNEQTSLREAIALEKNLLIPVVIEADLKIDTTSLSVHQMRDMIRQAFCDDQKREMTVLFQSFGFKNGIPSDADFIFDVRCLPNPFWDESLRGYTGLEQPVIDFLKDEPQVIEMIEDIRVFIEKWLPRFESAQRSYMTIAIGCTGGQHRSVYIGKTLGTLFTSKLERVQVRHRELHE
ncbi:RNase adapter RapZ [Endozoicomonas sp. SCSIO W0465]|uniref:RNase adapter RapZ n=1 Tax=Endozoicomonas sp. SCSIO W0465 TaxID=2918516 RepID=UPI002075A7B4|nr:RNase adapter RapZ [Endozoicomonas sp. SCSIO W0465]USE38237.1 RNase adapter RapZ [Endozoicomonas sp. SCSIO W0465]